MIKLENISKTYANATVLKDVNLTFSPGEFTMLLGKSGSGKSSLLNIIGLMDEASSGQYYFNEVAINHQTSAQKSDLRAHKFGFIFQRYNLINSLSVLDNILLAAQYANTPNALARAKELANWLGIEHLLHKHCACLSGGEQQRVSIARALINQPQFILADEPTGALDSTNAAALMQELRALHQNGVGIIMVTHDEQLQSYADRIIRLKDAQIISDSLVDKANKASGKKILPATASFSTNLNKANKASGDNITNKANQTCSINYRLFKSLIKDALRNILAHKMRSWLSVLGIIIASAAVVCTIALGNGAKANVLEQISYLGNNTIIVQKGSRLGDVKTQKLRNLDFADIELLRSLPYVADVGLISTLNAGFANYKDQNIALNVQGVLPNYLHIKNKKLLIGRFFSYLEYERASAVVVLSFSAAKSLFKDAKAALNKTILINFVPLRVIGVLAKDLQDSEGFDLNALISSNALATRFSGDYVIRRLYVLLKNDAPSKAAEASIKQTLELRKGANSIVTYNLDAIKQTIEGTANALSTLIFAIAAIAMIVGGIGIMNIMLVAINERKKEIGIRLAIGARAQLIAAGFLIESLILSLLGSLMGAIIASVLSIALNAAQIPMLLSLKAYILGIGLSAICGIVFGYFPAKKALKLNPAQCLLEL